VIIVCIASMTSQTFICFAPCLVVRDSVIPDLPLVFTGYSMHTLCVCAFLEEHYRERRERRRTLYYKKKEENKEGEKGKTLLRNVGIVYYIKVKKTTKMKCFRYS
jgi:hypothetical protein